MQSNPVAASNSCRPQQSQSMGFPPPQRSEPLPCPRCDSTATKFCYYNNYNLSQPRYLCKSCRRYWTHGGTLRNVPVGGASRKTKTSKKSRTTTTSSTASSSSLPLPVPSTTATAHPPSASPSPTQQLLPTPHIHISPPMLSLNSEAESSLGLTEFSYGFTGSDAALLGPFSESDNNAWDDDLAWPTLAISTPHHPPNNDDHLN